MISVRRTNDPGLNILGTDRSNCIINFTVIMSDIVPLSTHVIMFIIPFYSNSPMDEPH